MEMWLTVITADLHDPVGNGGTKKRKAGRKPNCRPELASKNFFGQTTTNE